MSSIRILLLNLLATGFTTAQAETIHVPGNHPTIQSAISAAASGDVIQVAAGTFYEHGLAFDNESPLVTIQGTRAKNGATALMSASLRGHTAVVLVLVVLVLLAFGCSSALVNTWHLRPILYNLMLILVHLTFVRT